MKNGIGWFGSCRRAVLLVAGCAFAMGASAQAMVDIGATVPLTGPLSLSGKQYFNSLKLAEQDINAAGGVQGKKVNFIFEDAQGSNGTAVNAFVKIVQERKPAFVFLTSYSTQAAATSPEVIKAGVPVMYAGSADSVSALKNHWMFRLRPPDTVSAVAMAQFVKNTLKASKPGIIYIQNDFGQGGANEAAKALEQNGIKPVGQEAYGQNDKDMSAQLLNLKNKGADSIIAFVYPQDGALVLRQIKMLGLKQQVIASSGVFVPAAMNLLSPADLENVWGVLDADLQRTEKGRNFATRYKAKFNVDADPYAAAYYDGAMLVARGINAVGTDPAKLREYLAAVKDYEGTSHVYKADEKGDLAHDVTVVKFKPGTKDSQFVDFIAVP